MATGKRYSTDYLVDSNNNTGSTGQVLTSTLTGIDWANIGSVPGGFWAEIGSDIYSTNSGNVGIGTTTPSAKLHLRDPGTDSDVGIKIGNDSRDWNLKVMGSVSDSLQFFTHDNSNVMTILPSGNVGIGTISPDAKLEVTGGSGAIAGTGLAYFNNTDDAFSLVLNNVGTSSQNDRGVFDARVGGSSVFRINNSGNVGIGTTSPGSAYKLDVDGIVNFRSEMYLLSTTARMYLGSGTGYCVINKGSGITGTATRLYFGEDADSGLTMFRGTGHFTVSSANVGIGVTAPTKKLDVIDTINGAYGTSTQQTVARFFNKANDATVNSAFINLQCSSDNEASNPVAAIGVVSEGTSSNNGSFVAATRSGGGIIEQFKISSAGAIKFNAYGAGTLVTDASGNITASSGGGAGGPFLPLAGGTLTGPTNLLLTLNPTSGNYGGILFKYAGAVKGLSYYNAGLMIFGGESGIPTRLQAGGQYGLHLDATNRNVHIGGTTDAAYKLQVTGTSFVSGTGTFAGSVTANTGSKITSSSTDTTLSIETTTGTTIFPILDFVSSHSTAGARIRVSGTDVISIDKSQNATFAGNVSITKASTPELILTDTTNNVNLLIAADDANTFLRSSSGAPILFQTNAGTTALTLDSNQNALFSQSVGINMTSTPAATLHVTGTIFATAKFGNLVTGTSGVQFEAPDTAMQTCRFDSDALRFYAGGSSSPSTRFTITESGTSTFISTVTATNFILSSDETLKDNIKEIDNKHIDVNWKNFELKSEPGVKRSGVIAQELEKKHPEFVRTDDEGLKSVAYIDLLISKIAELEARLEKAGI